MRRAIELARSAAASGNYALGAIVVQGDEILGECGSGLADGHDPSAHPEIVAIRRAAERKRSRYLEGAHLVTTLEPCVMCAAAAIWAKMAGIVFGARLEDAIACAEQHPAGRLSWRQIRLPTEQVLAAGDPRLSLRGDVLRAHCLELFGLASGAGSS